MGTKEKLLERIKTLPKDFTFEEAERILKNLGYTKSNKGKTSGSRVLFYKDGAGPVFMHRPHPSNILPGYAVKQLLAELTINGEFES